MTGAERAVRARYPDAECWRRNDIAGVAYAVQRSAAELLPILGIGLTGDEAWAHAAARLDIDPAAFAAADEAAT